VNLGSGLDRRNLFVDDDDAGCCWEDDVAIEFSISTRGTCIGVLKVLASLCTVSGNGAMTAGFSGDFRTCTGVSELVGSLNFTSSALVAITSSVSGLLSDDFSWTFAGELGSSCTSSSGSDCSPSSSVFFNSFSISFTALTSALLRFAGRRAAAMLATAFMRGLLDMIDDACGS